MKRRHVFAVLTGLLCLIPALLSAQEPMRIAGGEGSGTSEKGGEPLVLRYDFSEGESVTYRLLSYDSIVVWDKAPKVLVRQRIERMTYRCDTILPEGYGMTLTLDDAVVREQFDSLPWMVRSDHPWIGKPVRFLMAPNGERLRLRDTMETHGSMPGAPFQPLLIPHLGRADTVSIGAGGVFERAMWLLDNVYPPVQWTGGAIRKIIKRADTLGHSTVLVELSETGQVWYNPPKLPGGGGDEVETHTRVNGGGHYWIDFDQGYPVAGDYQLIGTITFINKANGKERSGRHTMSTEFYIDDGYDDLLELFDVNH